LQAPHRDQMDRANSLEISKLLRGKSKLSFPPALDIPVPRANHLPVSAISNKHHREPRRVYFQRFQQNERCSILLLQYF